MPDEKSLLRITILHLIAILFVIFNVSDIRIAGFSSLIPLFDLMFVFYFGIFRKTFAVWFIFLLGIWNDSINGNAVGTTALCYILLVKFFQVLNERMMIRENFFQIWKQFTVFCFLFLLMKWLILSAFNGAAYSVITPLVQLILSSTVYVVIHGFCGYLSAKLLEG